MRLLLPYPIASAGLFGLWLLLNQSLSSGHILLGGVVGLVEDGRWRDSRCRKCV